MEAPENPPTMSVMDALMESDEERTELDKIFEQFLDPRNIDHNTELSVNEITAFSAIAPLAEKHGLTAAQKYMERNLIFRVSKGRGGRKEWVKIITRQLERQEFAENGGGGFARMMSGRGRGGSR